MSAIVPLYPLSAQAVPMPCIPSQVVEKEDLILTNDLAEDLKAVESALSECDRIFSRGGELVRVMDDPLAGEAGSPTIPLQIQSLSASALKVILSKVRRFLKENEDGLVSVYPPGVLVNGLLEIGDYPHLRHLRGVTQVPVLRPDGTILQEVGYDHSTELLYQPLTNFPRVRELPTAQEIKAALDLLLEVVVDFPFAEPEKGKAVFLATVLTFLGRFAFPGPIPMILIEANVQGAGKGKLADAVGLITTNRTIPRSTQLHCETEERKRITSILRNGDRFYLIDNACGRLCSPSLAALLTSDTWADRILNQSRQVTLPNHVQVIVTGNNIQVEVDMVRRGLLVQLLSMEEHPEARSAFRHPDLEKWIREHQPELLTAALTILRGYVAAGRPVQSIVTLGNYGGWSGLIQSAVKWAFGTDPGEARISDGDDMDLNREILQLLISGWSEIAPNGEAWNCKQAMNRIKNNGLGRTILDALELANPDKKPSAIRLGGLLRTLRKRVHGGAFFDHGIERGAGGHRWKLITGPSATVPAPE